ncbi:hypothetical protein IAD21_00162 [Abditibacteriota bacterium]|nr:hypothetical protein IAD21_00162 [Abditibacteriota bacterium]
MPLFLATMTLIFVLMGKRVRDKGCFHLLIEAAVVVFEHQYIIAFIFVDGVGDVLLTVRRISGDNGAFEIQQLKQRGRQSLLAPLIGKAPATQHHAHLTGKDAHRGQSAHVALMLPGTPRQTGTPRQLAINAHMARRVGCQRLLLLPQAQPVPQAPLQRVWVQAREHTGEGVVAGYPLRQ